MRGTVSALCAGILCAVPACADRAETLLHDAARTGDFSEVKALTKAGADPKARAEYGRIPFDYADDNKALQGTNAYRRLKEGRFE